MIEYRPPTLWALIHLERDGLPFHGVGINCINDATTEIKAQEPSIWAKGYMLGNCACVIRLELTSPSRWRENVLEYLQDCTGL